MKAVATLSMFNTGRVRRKGYMSTQIRDIQERLTQASLARGEEAAAGTVDFDSLTDEAIEAIPNDLYREGMKYYGKTHRHPNSTFEQKMNKLKEFFGRTL